jgi:hypothetical protein
MPSLEIEPTMDSELNAHAADTNYGSAVEVIIGASYIGPAKTSLYRPIVNFDVSAVAGVQVDAALLRRQIYVSGGASVNAFVSRCTRPATWTEAGVTWNKYDGVNAWTAGGGDFDDMTPPKVTYLEAAGAGVVEILGLKGHVDDALANRSGVVSLIMRLDDETPDVSNFRYWYSKDTAPGPHRWRLIVDYSTASNPPGRGAADVRSRRPRLERAPRSPLGALRPRRGRPGLAGAFA